MNRGDKGKRPIKGRGHLPQGELIALGSKVNTKDDATKQSSNLPSKKTNPVFPDRKRDSPTPLQAPRVPKRPKLSTSTTSLQSTSISIDIESRGPVSPPLPPVTPLEVSAEELEEKVINCDENDDETRCDAYIMGALKTLRVNRSKPNTAMYLSLLCLVKRKPYLFQAQRVVDFLTSLLRRETAVNLKGVRPSPVLPIMACNILLCAFQDELDWPEVFIKVFVEDCLGDRTWVEHEKCRIFVNNLLTVFSTKLPGRNNEATKTEPLLSEGPVSSPKIIKTEGDEDIFLKDMECTESISPEPENVIPRYTANTVQDVIHGYVVELILDQLTRRQLIDNTTRNLLRLMSFACGLNDVRLLASQRLEVWLQNPKLNRPAQELLMSLSLNCNSHSVQDIEVISNIIKMRLKTKQLAAHYITCVRVLVEQHEDNLGTLLKHIIYNELSQTRNPNNMSLLSVLFQYEPENAARSIARVFQDLLMNREDYLRAIRALLREIVRALRHDLNFVALCRGFLTPRNENNFQDLDTAIKERMFVSSTDLIIVTIFLSITPSVRDALLAYRKGETKDIKVLHEFQKNVAIIQQDSITWLHNVVPNMFPINATNYQQSLSKVLFMEPAESYSAKDSWPTESERSFILSVVSDVPVLDDSLTRITVIGLSQELPLDPAKALKFVETLVQRAANVKTGVPPIQVNRLRLIDAVLDLSIYHYPPNIQLPSGYEAPSLAIANLYWTSWMVILVVAAFNPSKIGSVVWERFPTMRCLMEMMMTNNFVFPPPTMVESAEEKEELQRLEAQISAAEKEDILLFETHLAAASTGKTITEDTSLLISQLISMVPDGPARKPPEYITKQLKTLNANIGIGKLFCRCRSPDFLLEIIQRQSASQSRPWLAELVLSSQESLDVLPVQCLCEFLLLQAQNEGNNEETEDTKGGRRKETIDQVLHRLQFLLFSEEATAESTSEALECFVYRVHARSTVERNCAVKALSLIFSSNDSNVDASSNKNYSWLLDIMPLLPHFNAVLNTLSYSLRMACTEELDFQRLQAYITFLSKFSLEDYAEEVSLELSRLILERPNIIEKVLCKTSEAGNNTHCSLLNVFWTVLTRALDNGSDYNWDDHNDATYITWSKGTMHSGKATTLAVYVIHASWVLLTFGAPENDDIFELLLNSWCPIKGELKMSSRDNGEDVSLSPDWLTLKMICSNVPRIVDQAFHKVEAHQLIVFIQSFGIPVQNTSKILKQLDVLSENDGEILSEMISDKRYMLQLIGVHRSRGAIGGLQFCQLLTNDNLDTEVKPFKEQRLTPLRVSRYTTGQDDRMDVDTTDGKAKIKYLVSKIYPLSDNITNSREQTHYGFQLQKLISTEVSHLEKGIDISETIAEKFIKILTNFLESKDASVFAKVFFSLAKISHPFLRMLIARQTILEKQGDNSSFPKLLELLYQHKSDNGPVSLLVTNYHEKHVRTRNRTSNEPVSDEYISTKVDEIKAGRSLTNNEVKQMISVINKTKQQLDFKQLLEVLSWLRSTCSPYLEEYLRSLISLLITPQSTDNVNNHTKLLIQHLIGCLRTSSDVTSRVSDGVIIDWLPVLDADIVNLCPLQQRQLLFGTSGDSGDKEGSSEDHEGSSEDHEVTRGLLLLVLLTHSGSWCHLQDSLDWLLGQRANSNMDVTCALRFIESCLSIPQLWQGQDTKCSKGIDTSSCNNELFNGEILNLSQEQLRNIVLFILMEAKNMNSKEFSDESLNSILERRVSLLIRCSKGKEKQLCSVMKHVLESEDARWSNELRHRLFNHLYLHLPEVLSSINNPQEIINLEFITQAKSGKFDSLLHRIISILSECEPGEVWQDSINGVVLLCRKMASLYPTHILRILPMISSLLRGRTHLTTKQFSHQNHFLFFSNILVLLDSLKPHVFNSCQYVRSSLQEALDNFLELVQSDCINDKERSSVVAKLVEFFQHFLTSNPTVAFEYLQKRVECLEDLLVDHSKLSSLKSLLAVLSVPRSLDGEQSNMTCKTQLVPSSLVVMTPVSTPWSQAQIEPFLQKIASNQPIGEVLQVLIDLDETSKRRVDILQYFLNDMVRLTKDVNESCRTKAHELITRHLKQNPSDSKLVVNSYLECLSSSEPEVVCSAVKVLPEISILSAESSDELLGKAFIAATQKLNEIGKHVTKAIQLFNIH